jgi:hypothetical protein
LAVGNIPTGSVTLPSTNGSDSITNPDIGLGGKVSVVGAGFGKHKGIVKIGGKAASVVTWKDTLVVVKLPSLTANVYPVNVLPYKSKTAINVGNVTLHAPTVASLSSNNGLRNTKIKFTVNGQYFGIGVKPKVYLVSSTNKRTPLNVANSSTDLLISVTTPRLKTGIYQLMITNSTGQSMSQAFVVQ